MKPYYLNYLKEKSKDEYFDDLKFELDKRVYHYGNQFKINYDNNNNIVNFLKIQYRKLKLITDLGVNIQKCKNIAINNAYYGINEELIKINFTPLKVPWFSSYNKCKLYFDLIKYDKYLNVTTFDNLLGEEAHFFYTKIKNDLHNYYSNNNIKILSTYNDVCSYEKISINIFKKLNKPSFEFLHGIPGRYKLSSEMRSDFLVVWGKKIKEHYINSGINGNKILVSGHPDYKNYELSSINIKMTLENILVLSKGAHSLPQGESVQLADRGNLILYLLEIQETLKKRKIKFVRFRPHPSEDINWYYKFISKEFFRPDQNINIIDSIKSSSLVIGPRSTSLFNSIMNNVNYIVYDPLDHDNLDYINFPQAPPFDKSDDRIVTASSKDELLEIITNSQIVNKEILLDYLEPKFDINFLKSYL